MKGRGKKGESPGVGDIVKTGFTELTGKKVPAKQTESCEGFLITAPGV